MIELVNPLENQSESLLEIVSIFVSAIHFSKKG